MRRCALVLLVAFLGWLGGCTVGRTITSPGKESVTLTTIDRNYLNVVLRFTPVAEELTRELKQPVSIFSDANVRSVKAHLSEKTNYYDLVYVDPVEFCRIEETAPLTPVAVRVNPAGQTAEVGMIVVRKNSPIKTIADLKGKRFAFGGHDSAYQFFNVLEYFKAEGFAVSLLKDVSYNKDSLAVSQKVLLNLADAGVVTRSWWQTTTDRRLDLTKLLKDDLRVIGETQALPEYVWATTGAVTPARRQVMEKVLTQAMAKKHLALAGFSAQGFKPAPAAEWTAACGRLKKIKSIPPSPQILPLP